MTPRAWRNASVTFGLIALAALAFRGCYHFVHNEENAPAAESIVSAMEAYRKENGRCPATLEDMQPKFLASIPKSVNPFVIVYAASVDGKQCWVAYQVHRDNFEEYDSAVGKWQLMEYEETRALREERKQILR
jgi:hypothetical protein